MVGGMTACQMGPRWVGNPESALDSAVGSPLWIPGDLDVRWKSGTQGD